MVRAARELGEAHGDNGARLRHDERERERSEASENEWERAVGAWPSCPCTGLTGPVIVGV